jgi:hypothetical protein
MERRWIGGRGMHGRKVYVKIVGNEDEDASSDPQTSEKEKYNGRKPDGLPQ